MKNKKGFCCPLFLSHCCKILIIGGGGKMTLALLAPKIAFGVLALACIWHIPAWEKAKATGGDAPAIYQAQEMWPQQLFDKLPGVHTRTGITFAQGNGGNFIGGNSTTQ